MPPSRFFLGELSFGVIVSSELDGKTGVILTVQPISLSRKSQS
jgi:hypothetical protein